MRLDRFISLTLDLTRKEATNLIKKGYITLNDEIIINPSIDVKDGIVKYNNQELKYQEFIYLLLSKPAGYVSSTKDNKPTVIDLIDGYKKRDLFPVGRLDIDTYGLLLITNDGALSHKLTHPKSHIPKVYDVITDGVLDDAKKIEIEKGLNLDNFKTLPCNISMLSDSHYEITIYEGQFHEVKKLFKYANLEVLKLTRIKMGPLTLDGLETGMYRELTIDEINKLKAL